MHINHFINMLKKNVGKKVEAPLKKYLPIKLNNNLLDNQKKCLPIKQNNNIIIGDTPYSVDIVKNNDTIKITATNIWIKNSYSIFLDEKKLNQIVSNSGLNCNLDKFYELLMTSLKNNNKINLSGKLNSNQLILNLSISLIEDLDYSVNYVIVLDKTEKSDIARLEEIIIDLRQINLSKKWIDINEDDINYYFGYDKQHIFEVDNRCDVPIILKIPDEIIKKSSKIKVKYIIRCNSSNSFACKIWTKNYVLFDHDLYNRYEDGGEYSDLRTKNPDDTGENGLYTTTIINKIDINNDNRIFIKLIGCKVIFYLISYKIN